MYTLFLMGTDVFAECMGRALTEAAAYLLILTVFGMDDEGIVPNQLKLINVVLPHSRSGYADSEIVAC